MSSLKTLILVSCLSACGRQIVEFQNGQAADAGADSGSGSAVAPRVIATVPLNGATGVARDTAVYATFSKAMNAATITTTTFTVMQGTTAVSGGVLLDPPSNTATFMPSAPLGASLVYTATITTGAQDLGGHALAANYTWTFTTGANVSLDPPRVIFTSPPDLATNVSVNKKPTATFSKAMDPTTITMLTFTLTRAGNPVLGTVRYDAPTNTAMFSPTTPLALSTLYVGTITTGAKDTNGLALAANYVWSFTTGACSLAAIDLGTAGNFAVLAGSTVTNTGLSMVTGDLGVSPGTAVTGFPPGVLVGAQHAGDPTSATALGDLTTAFNNAAGLSLCAVTVAGDLGGMTLAPGLYKSTSSLAITTSDLTLDGKGDVDAVFIFDMASTFTTAPGKRVVVTNGAQAKNIFWQVGTSATINTTSVMFGTIMADQAISLLTGASLTGRALARIAAVSLDTNIVVKQ